MKETAGSKFSCKSPIYFWKDYLAPKNPSKNRDGAAHRSLDEDLQFYESLRRRSTTSRRIYLSLRAGGIQ